MGSAPAANDYNNPTPDIFDLRVTFGNQSRGYSNCSVPDGNYGQMVWGSSYNWQSFYQAFYENNFLFIGPACGSNGDGHTDTSMFLVPFYLQSVGISGSDCQLMKPILWMAGSIPPAIKTRMMRRGLYVPILMYLYKSGMAGDIRSSAAHVNAWLQPAEATTGSQYTSTPILDRMVNNAHALQHIPPVATFSVESAVYETQSGFSYPKNNFYMAGPYNLVATVRMGERLVLTVNLSGILDDGQSIVTGYASMIRGPGTIEYLNPQKSRIKITIPWFYTTRNYDLRSDVLLLVNDGTYDSAPAYISIRNVQAGEAVGLGLPAYPDYVDPVKCYVFYNNSAFDGNDPAANAADDAAIATDKTPLRPGGTATFANYTSYSKGINGIMLDIANMPGTPTKQDFVITTGNSNDSTQWASKPKYQLTIRKGAGANGSDRVTVTFTDGTVINQWMKIMVLASANTGLWTNETFYFGNAIGETGNASGSAAVNNSDLSGVRVDPHRTFANPASITNRYDINRDKRVSSSDEVIVRTSFTTVLNEVKLIAPPLGPGDP